MDPIKLLKSGILITIIGIIVSLFGILNFYYVYLPSVALEIIGLSIIARVLIMEYQTRIENRLALKIEKLLLISIFFYCIYFIVQLLPFPDFERALISLGSQIAFGLFLSLAGFYIAIATKYQGFELLFFGLLNFVISLVYSFGVFYYYSRIGRLTFLPSSGFYCIVYYIALFLIGLLFLTKLGLVLLMTASTGRYFGLITAVGTDFLIDHSRIT